MIDRETFFNHVRSDIFGGSMSDSQVHGCNAILGAWEDSPHTDQRWLAYMLATAYHEVAGTMRPIKEYGGPDYFRRMYDIKGERPHVARSLGNTEPGDGVRFAGRGYVQLTGRANYARAGRALGVDLVDDPDLALQPDIAAEIMLSGMTEGWFTGRKLSDYFSAGVEEWVNARRIINALDRAELIARYGESFYSAILVAEHASKPPPDRREDPEPVGFWQRIAAFFRRLFS